MKIVIAADIFPPAIGGPAGYSKKIADVLHKRGHDVTVICYSDADDASFAFSVIRIPSSRYKIAHYIHYFIKLFSLTKGADVIYAQGPVAAGFPATLVGKLTRKKVLIKVVGDYAWEQARNREMTEERIDDFQKTQHQRIIGIFERIERFTAQRAARVIVPSKYLQSIVERWGVSKNRISVIYNAADTKPSIRRESKKFDSIISMGRLVPWKGFEALIKIMPSLVRKNPKFRLLILGGGPLEGHLMGLIAEYQMTEHIKIRQVIPEERDTLMSEAKLFVLNTDYEGLSHALLEVMSLGVPIITTNVGGNPELIENEKNGLLVNFNDEKALSSSIMRLWRDTRLQQRFIEAGKRSAQKFSEEKMMRETITLLEGI